LSTIGDAGKKSLGLLSFALAPLDYLGGIVRAGAFSLSNIAGNKIDINRNELEDDYNFFTNMRRAVIKNPFDPTQRIAGFGDIPGLKFDSNDSFLEKLGKGTIAFTGDVLSDPTTYMSFGIAPVAKKLAAKTVAAQTADEAGKILAREAVEEVGEQAATGLAQAAAERMSLAAARQVAKDSALTKLASRNLNIANEAAVKNVSVEDYVSDLLQTNRDELQRLVSDQIGDEATAIFRTKKRASLRKYFDDLADETGVDEFRGLWQKQSDAVRGGFQITKPLGKPVKRLTEGGQSPIGDFISKQSAKAAASRPGLFLTTGRERELIKSVKVLGQGIDTPGGLARAAQAESALRTAQRAATRERELIRKLGPQAKTLIASAQRITNAMDNEIEELTGETLGDLVRQDVKRWYNDFDAPDDVQAKLLDSDIGAAASEAGLIAAREARSGFEAARASYEAGVPLPEILADIDDKMVRRQAQRWYRLIGEDQTGRLLNDPIDEVKERVAEQAQRVAADGLRISRSLRDFMYDNYSRLQKELGEDFSEVGIVDGALREVTDAARSLERDLFGTQAARTGTGKPKSRAAFFTTREDGTKKWFTLEEANAAQRENYRQLLEEEVAAGRIAKESTEYKNFSERIDGMEWFETDPEKIFANRVNKLERGVHKAVAVNLFKKAGLLVEADATRGLRPKAVMKAAREELERLGTESGALTQEITRLTRVRPGAPSGEAAQMAEDLAVRAEQVGGQFFTPVQPVIELGEEARRVAGAVTEEEGTITRAIDRVENEIGVLHARVQENATDAETLKKAIAAIDEADPDEQVAEFAALLDTVITMKEAQANRLAASVGQTADVQELRSAANRLREAKKRQATAVINLTARAEPLSRVGTATDRRGFLIPVENQFADLWAPQTIVDALANSYKVVNESKTVVENALRTTTGFWKQWATFGRGPGFVFRNLGGWWNAFLVGANGKDFRSGIQYATQYELALRDVRKQLKDVQVGDINGVVDLIDNAFQKRMGGKQFMGVDMYEAHQLMEAEGIFGGTITAAAMDVDPYTNVPRSVRAGEVYGRGRQQVLVGPNESETVWEQVRSGQLTMGEALKEVRKLRPAEAAKQVGKGFARGTINNPYMYVMKAFSEDSERFLRASTFAAGMRQYGTDATGSEMAGMLVKASQFDYTDLSPAEQRVMKLISPFFVWTKNNVPYQFRNLFANPGKVNAILDLQQNVERYFGDEDDTMDKYLPDWLSEQMGFASQFGSGENKLALSMNLPLTDLNRVFQIPVTETGNLAVGNPLDTARTAVGAAFGGLEEQSLTSLNPFLKAPIESVTGVNLFTGAKFTDQAAGPAFRAATQVPIIGRLLPDTYVDPESGEVRASSYAINQFRNLLPQLGQLDRLLPFGQQGSAAERLQGNWISQGLSFLPVTVSATLTESQYAGELRTRNLKLEQQIRDYERANGLMPGSVRDQYNEAQKALSKKSRDRALAAALAP
jgi:hypothetical protein